MTQTRVVIVGGGFGGLSVATQLLHSRLAHHLAITLVDAAPVSTYTPWLHDVAALGDDAHSSDIPLDSFSGLRFRLGTVQTLDPVARHVILQNGDAIPYDICVLALGSVSNDFGISGVKTFGISVKRTEDALAVSRKTLAVLRDASPAKPQNIVVVGGGVNGVEIAAECASIVSRYASAHPEKHDAVRVLLADSAEKPLPILSSFLRRKALDRLSALGVTLRNASALSAVTSDSVMFRSMKDGVVSSKEETLACALCICALGVKMPDAVLHLPFARHAKGRILVDTSLRVLGRDDVFALGDCAMLEHESFSDPQTAQVAVLQSQTVARNILALVSRRPVRRYVQRRRWDILIALGGKYVVGTALGIPVWGYTAFILRLFVDVRHFLSVLPFQEALRRVFAR